MQTILFEVPLLAIISEVYARNQYPNCDYSIAKKRLAEKISLIKTNPLLKNFLFSDFGTRRRFSFVWHDELTSILTRELPNNFCGTSNVFFAKKFNLHPIGTMAHEYIQGCQALSSSLRDSQKYAFELWIKEYGCNLSVALSDTYNLKVFLKDFDLNLCKMFDGVRQDSGDPFKCGDLIWDHYKSMGVDPRTKKIVFSDGLTFPLAVRLYNYFKERINLVFGIGTNLTNDLECAPIQIVIKMTECNGQPVAKITDNPDKVTCKDTSYLAYLKKVFETD
ncbi:MAG: nicotinate phosphoribosyltransferase [bacterium]